MGILKKIYFSLIFNILLTSVLFMWLMPYGTFDYTRYEFYICIVAAIALNLFIRWYLKKYQKDFMGKLK